MIIRYGGDTCAHLYICILCIAFSMDIEEGAEVNSSGCVDGAKICMKEEAEVNFEGHEDGAKICMEERAEVNSGECEDGANYSGNKLYVVIINFSSVYVAFSC